MFGKSKRNKISEPIILTTKTQIEKASNMVNSALTVFTKVITDIETANNILEDSIDENSRKIDDLNSRLEQAQKEQFEATEQINVNKNLQDKIKQFTI